MNHQEFQANIFPQMHLQRIYTSEISVRESLEHESKSV